MSITLGYRIPNDPRGRAFTLPDAAHGLVTEADAERIAQELRAEQGREPHWQTVRGRLLKLTNQRRAQK